MKINIVNEKKRTKGKNVAKRRRKKTTTKKRRRRRSNPVTALVRQGTRRPARRSRRRANPNGMAIFGGVADMFKGVGGMFAGTLFAGWVAQRIGSGQLGLPGMPMAPLPTSPMAGSSWPIWTYFATALGGQFVGNWLGRSVGRDFERDFKKGIALSIVQKLTYTELFARQPWMQQTFGNTLVRTTDGNTFYQAGAGQPYNAMMGYGQILEARPLDGTIVPASPMDGTIVRAGPLDTGVGPGGRRYARRRRRAMGHYYPATGEPKTEAERHALWLGTGSPDVWQATYS